MEKTTLKAKKDREELQSELDDLTGRSKGDAKRATEVICGSDFHRNELINTYFDHSSLE